MDWIVWRSFFLRSRHRETDGSDKTRGIKEEGRVILLYLPEEDFVLCVRLNDIYTSQGIASLQ
jgi:hypothetical protein